MSLGGPCDRTAVSNHHPTLVAQVWSWLRKSQVLLPGTGALAASPDGLSYDRQPPDDELIQGDQRPCDRCRDQWDSERLVLSCRSRHVLCRPCRLALPGWCPLCRSSVEHPASSFPWVEDRQAHNLLP